MGNEITSQRLPDNIIVENDTAVRLQAFARFQFDQKTFIVPRYEKYQITGSGQNHDRVRLRNRDCPIIVQGCFARNFHGKWMRSEFWANCANDVA